MSTIESTATGRTKSMRQNEFNKQIIKLISVANAGHPGLRHYETAKRKDKQQIQSKEFEQTKGVHLNSECRVKYLT